MQVHSFVVSDIADIAGASQRFIFADWLFKQTNKKIIYEYYYRAISENKYYSTKYGDYSYFKTQ